MGYPLWIKALNIQWPEISDSRPSSNYCILLINYLLHYITRYPFVGITLAAATQLTEVDGVKVPT